MSTIKLTAPSPQKNRDELESLVRKELYGPFGGKEEEIDDWPTVRYLVGMLAPPDEVSGDIQNDEFAIGGQTDQQDGKTESTQVRSDTLFPSSVGLTFVVDESVIE